jgi:hypothetical protein
MPLRLLDPTVLAPPVQAAAAPRLKSLDGLRIGVLWNGKVNADTLLRETANCFSKRHGCSLVSEERKPSASIVAKPQVLQRLAEKSDFLITAVGD